MCYWYGMGQRRYNHSEIRSWFLMDSEKNISGGVAIEHFGSKLATGYGCDAHLGEPLKGERRERSKINLGTELRLSLLEPERNHERLSVRPCLFNRRLELDPAQTDPAPDFTGSGSGKTGSRSSFCRIQIRFLPDLVPVAITLSINRVTLYCRCHDLLGCNAAAGSGASLLLLCGLARAAWINSKVEYLETYRLQKIVSRGNETNRPN